MVYFAVIIGAAYCSDSILNKLNGVPCGTPSSLLIQENYKKKLRLMCSNQDIYLSYLSTTYSLVDKIINSGDFHQLYNEYQNEA